MSDRPSGSPECWGKKYQDGERVCENCSFNYSCRPRMLERLSNIGRPALPPPRTSTPVVSTAPLPTASSYQQKQPQQMVPMPSRPFQAPQATSVPAPVHVVNRTPSAAPATTQTQQPYYYNQTASGYQLHNPTNPNPLSPMHRPGAQGPAYYLNQYPGENVGLRVLKNVILRALEVVFFELAQFFRHWSWPSR